MLKQHPTSLPYPVKNWVLLGAVALLIGYPAVAPRAQIKLPPIGQLAQDAKQKLAEDSIATLLNNELPLKLDANAIYPTVAAPPGGPFTPSPVVLTPADLDNPLPPGDYAINMLAFCTEYSVHRPGAGVAYRLGPLQGKAAGAIGDLLWRGTFQKNLPPQQLQAVSWAIQSGLRYSQMPNTYQTVIDNVIPDHKNELNGDFFQNMEDSYTNLAKGTKLPPLQQMLGGMGKTGQLALSADRQRQALLRQNTSDQIKEQTLFAGQDQGVYTPVKEEEGPWTERIPGVAYLRYKIAGGNMARNNVMEIRILPQAGGGQTANNFGNRSSGSLGPTPRSLYGGIVAKSASFTSPETAPKSAPQTETPPAPAPTSPHALIGGSIGCAVGQGAQCLIPVPATASCDSPCVGHAELIRGQVQIKRGNNLITLKPGDQINQNDQIITGRDSRVELYFADSSQITLAQNTNFLVDDVVYDPKNSSRFSWLVGAYLYTRTFVCTHITDCPPPRVGYVGAIRGEAPVDMRPVFARSYTWSGRAGAGLFVAKMSVTSSIRPAPTPEPQNATGVRNEFIASYDAASMTGEVDLIEGQLYLTPGPAAAEILFTGPVKITMNPSGATEAPLARADYDAIKARLFP